MTVLRALVLLTHVLLGVSLMALAWPFLAAQRRSKIERWWAQRLLKLVNVKVRIEGQWPSGPCMWVSNHVSWVDIFVFNALHPVKFIAKAEIASWPLAGYLAKKSGTLFIERGKRHAVRAVLHAARDCMKAGDQVAVFPEGTTSDGRGLLPFHNNLLQAAIEAGTAVQPVALRYTDARGQFTDLPAYIGDQSLVENIRVLWAHPQGFTATLSVLPALTVEGQTRHTLGDAAYKAISQQLQGGAEQHSA